VTSAAHTAGPLIVVKRDEEEFRQWVSTEIGFLSVFGSFDDEPLKVEDYQLAFLRSKANYRCVEKARQVGYSWLFACEALARAHLRDTYTGVFVSYNLADAKEKIAYCQQMHDELPLEYQKKRITDSKLELAFQSNNASRRVSRIISNPSKAPRGKKGDIYLDELAHCTNDREIYKGSTALILRSSSQLSTASSPLGRRGIFWEIARQEVQAYPSYWRQSVPWWLCSFLCKDTATASKVAPTMATHDRVAMFGKKNIKEQFASLLLEDFQQEFEVLYSDETLTFFPYDLILPNTSDDVVLFDDITELAGLVKGRVVIGYDVGRKRDYSAMAVCEEMKNGSLVLRMMREFDKVPFAQQESACRVVLDTLPVARFSIDNNGIGMMLAENLHADYPQVIPEDFTTPSKEMWCTDLKIRFQKHTMELPKDRDLTAQIHSIKKSVTSGGRVTFDADRDAARGHADKFWALALAAQKERRAIGGGNVAVRVFG
jgi:phage FluMu gp28-like protein